MLKWRWIKFNRTLTKWNCLMSLRALPRTICRPLSIVLIRSPLIVCLSGLTHKHFQADANESRLRTCLEAMPTCLRVCCECMLSHLISSSLNLIWLVCPSGGGEELHPAGCSPQAAVTHSASSLRELVMRPAKFFPLLPFYACTDTSMQSWLRESR